MWSGNQTSGYIRWAQLQWPSTKLSSGYEWPEVGKRDAHRNYSLAWAARLSSWWRHWWCLRKEMRSEYVVLRVQISYYWWRWVVNECLQKECVEWSVLSLFFGWPQLVKDWLRTLSTTTLHTHWTRLVRWQCVFLVKYPPVLSPWRAV